MESEENIKPFPSLPTVLGNRQSTSIPTLRTARRLLLVIIKQTLQQMDLY
jgi:hypothetical protein